MDRNPSTGRLHVHLADGTLHAILPKCDGARASLPSDYDGWEACVSPFFAPEFRCRPCSICSLLFCTVTPLSSVTLLTMTPKTRPLTRFLASLQCPINPSKHPMQVPLFFFITSLLLSASHPTPLLRALPLNPYFSVIQVLYIFTGLQNFDWIPRHDPERQSSGFDIIQPVLQACASFTLIALPS